MTDEINFMDLAVLLKITPNTPLEKLGGIMNSSIFDASNIAGSMKQKGLIEFTAYYPGPNSINITEQGRALISEADTKSSEQFDELDFHILQNLSGGKRLPSELQSSLNLRPKDLALRLYKESKQGFMTYDIKNGGIELMLTEKGFLQAKTGLQKQVDASAAAIAQTSSSSTARHGFDQPAAQQTAVQEEEYVQQQPEPEKIPETKQVQLKSEKNRWIIIIILIIVLAVLFVWTRR